MSKKEENILIGRRIRNIRNSLKLDQKEFAKKIGVTVSALSNWENGRNKPKDLPAKEIAKLGGIPLEELLYGKPQEFVYNVIIEEIDSYGELWFELSKMVKSDKKIDTPSLLYQEVIKLINDNFEEIYSLLNHHLFVYKFKNKEDFNIYDMKDSIIRTTIKYFVSISSRDYTFEEYYNRITKFLGVLGTSRHHGSIEEIKERLIKKGFDEKTASNKAANKFFISKAGSLLYNFKKDLKKVLREYEDYIDKNN